MLEPLHKPMLKFIPKLILKRILTLTKFHASSANLESFPDNNHW